MKWVYYGYHGTLIDSPCRRFEFLPFERFEKEYKNQLLNREKIIPVLKADYLSSVNPFGEAVKVLRGYDGIYLECFNVYYAPMAHKVRREVGGDKIIVTELEVFNPPSTVGSSYREFWLNSWQYSEGRMKMFKREVDSASVVVLDERHFIPIDFFNKLFDTDKFIVSRLPPLDLCGIRGLFRRREEKERLFLSNVHEWTKENIKETALILKKIYMKNYRYRAIMTNVDDPHEAVPWKAIHKKPFSWEDYLDLIADAYLGIRHFSGLGMAECVGAAVGTPYVGTDRIDGMVDCFPELAFKWKDFDSAVNRVIRLIEDEDFYEKVREKAWVRVRKYYSFENARKEFYKNLKERNLL